MEFKDIKTIGIVGSGTMGHGIAQVCAYTGFTTLLFDANADILSKTILAVTKNLSSSVSKGKFSSVQQEDILKRIKVTQHLRDVKVDLIIEAVVEKLEVK
jgi:3-hydroxybutyryl-CoA dehydrogenase